jgi:hypothetical protein
MSPGIPTIEDIDVRMTQLFALVSEALAGATEALLGNDSAAGLAVVEGDQSVDDLTELPPASGGGAPHPARTGALG